jgi:phenylacetic acid degradation operon negative regulatory protein
VGRQGAHRVLPAHAPEARAPALDLETAARESFILGGDAIRQIVYDPLLPPPLVDVEERAAFVAAMLAMDREGRRIWRRFFDAVDAGAGARVAPERRVH